MGVEMLAYLWLVNRVLMAIMKLFELSPRNNTTLNGSNTVKFRRNVVRWYVPF